MFHDLLAVGRSVDGNQIAVGRKNNLSIFSSNFEKISQVLLPMDIWTGESDTIRGMKLHGCGLTYINAVVKIT